MDIKNFTAAKIRFYRKAKGLTQKELGEKIGVKHNTVSGYESGTNEPEQNILFKIAAALEISINDLFPATTTSSAQAPTPGPDDLPTFSPTEQKIDARTRRQLEAVLDDDNLTYNGVVLDGDDKEKVKKALELIFWDVKEKNKRKKD